MSSSAIKQAPKTTISIITEHSPDPYHDIDEHTGYPLRCWSVSLRDARPGFEAVGTTLPYVRKVIFDLHETFDNPHRCISRPPFLVREKGWGEFTMKITIVWMDDALEPEVITHDLSFQNNGRYIMQKIVTFDRQRPSKMFMDLLNSRPSVSSKTVPPASRGATAGKANRTRKSLPRKAPPCPAPSSHPIHSRYSPDDVFDTDGEELSDIIDESDSESSMPLNYSTGQSGHTRRGSRSSASETASVASSSSSSSLSLPSPSRKPTMAHRERRQYVQKQQQQQPPPISVSSNHQHSSIHGAAGPVSTPQIGTKLLSKYKPDTTIVPTGTALSRAAQSARVVTKKLVAPIGKNNDTMPLSPILPSSPFVCATNIASVQGVQKIASSASGGYRNSGTSSIVKLRKSMLKESSAKKMLSQTPTFVCLDPGKCATVDKKISRPAGGPPNTSLTSSASSGYNNSNNTGSDTALTSDNLEGRGASKRRRSRASAPLTSGTNTPAADAVSAAVTIPMSTKKRKSPSDHYQTAPAISLAGSTATNDGDGAPNKVKRKALAISVSGSPALAECYTTTGKRSQQQYYPDTYSSVGMPSPVKKGLQARDAADASGHTHSSLSLTAVATAKAATVNKRDNGAKPGMALSPIKATTISASSTAEATSKTPRKLLGSSAAHLNRAAASTSRKLATAALQSVPESSLSSQLPDHTVNASKYDPPISAPPSNVSIEDAVKFLPKMKRRPKSTSETGTNPPASVANSNGLRVASARVEKPVPRGSGQAVPQVRQSISRDASASCLESDADLAMEQSKADALVKSQSSDINAKSNGVEASIIAEKHYPSGNSAFTNRASRLHHRRHHDDNRVGTIPSNAISPSPSAESISSLSQSSDGGARDHAKRPAGQTPMGALLEIRIPRSILRMSKPQLVRLINRRIPKLNEDDMVTFILFAHYLHLKTLSLADGGDDERPPSDNVSSYRERVINEVIKKIQAADTYDVPVDSLGNTELMQLTSFIVQATSLSSASGS